MTKQSKIICLYINPTARKRTTLAGVFKAGASRGRPTLSGGLVSILVTLWAMGNVRIRATTIPFSFSLFFSLEREAAALIIYSRQRDVSSAASSFSPSLLHLSLQRPLLVVP